jgi:hypothetical protein
VRLIFLSALGMLFTQDGLLANAVPYPLRRQPVFVESLSDLLKAQVQMQTRIVRALDMDPYAACVFV